MKTVMIKEEKVLKNPVEGSYYNVYYQTRCKSCGLVSADWWVDN